MGHRPNYCSRHSSEEDIVNVDHQPPQQQTTFIEDSGTESGEDLRLLVAGLGNKMDANSNEISNNRPTSTLLGDVQNALERLKNSLENEQSELLIDFSMNSVRKQSLLNLVCRLQETLTNGQIKTDHDHEQLNSNNDKQSIKKVKIKRSNTLDLSKLNDNKKNNLLSKALPNFVPKTENDKTFLAFIQKHKIHDNNDINYDVHKRQSLWIKHGDEDKFSKNTNSNLNGSAKMSNKENYKNWNNIFDNIKTVFEQKNGNSSSNHKNVSIHSRSKGRLHFYWHKKLFC